MSWSDVCRKEMRAGELLDGLFIGKGLIVLNPPKRKRLRLRGFKNLWKEIQKWI